MERTAAEDLAVLAEALRRCSDNSTAFTREDAMNGLLHADELRAFFLRLARDPAASEPAPEYVEALKELASVDAGGAQHDSATLACGYNLDGGGSTCPACNAA